MGYRELCAEMSAKGFLSRPLAEVRSFSGVAMDLPLPRMNVSFLTETFTYSAFREGQHLEEEFDPKEAFPVILRWTNWSRDSSHRTKEMKLLCDRANGIVRVAPDGCFAMLNDVADCLFLKSDSGDWISWEEAFGQRLVYRQGIIAKIRKLFGLSNLILEKYPSKSSFRMER